MGPKAQNTTGWTTCLVIPFLLQPASQETLEALTYFGTLWAKLWRNRHTIWHSIQKRQGDYIERWWCAGDVVLINPGVWKPLQCVGKTKRDEDPGSPMQEECRFGGRCISQGTLNCPSCNSGGLGPEHFVSTWGKPVYLSLLLSESPCELSEPRAQ